MLSLERIRFDIGINQLGSTSGAGLSWLEEKEAGWPRWFEGQDESQACATGVIPARASLPVESLNCEGRV